LAGGGTDVSPYSDLYGGAILNATLSLYAHATIEPIEENKVILHAIDQQEEECVELTDEIPAEGKLILLKGVYNRIQKDYGVSVKNFRLSTFVDAPAGLRAWNFFDIGSSNCGCLCRNVALTIGRI
jgi:D-glycero-alpha-D-manno-heptose-7-phosphate kinase